MKIKFAGGSDNNTNAVEIILRLSSESFSTSPNNSNFDMIVCSLSPPRAVTKESSSAAAVNDKPMPPTMMTMSAASISCGSLAKDG
eukprot:CAMPEP_0172484716 /NCGR_PEP_ID=MMETSP1066-20121228/12291_1 /TAXON_ID=671091 /ORGANISM="Coscinodiscus wailesii, Strain CCMP2513" /LENGTH=85 /DNA_ID=CAMNT_0013249411 /DNA_START=167 /DNA_END=421 /DNA_ORIENTATION=+